MSRATFAALGTTATVAVSDQAAMAAALEAVQREIAMVDAACSRFREDSELSAINRAGGRAVTVSIVLMEAVQLSLRAARLTGGRVVPTVGSAMRVLGYDRDFAAVTRVGPPLGVRVGPIPGWQLVVVDASSMTIRVPGGVELDLGATAKAWCADRAVLAAAALTGAGVLVSLGGDVAAAGPAPEGGWAVRVTNNHADTVDAPGQTVSISAGGLATSGTTVRRWARGAVSVHHIVDPLTGRPADPVWDTVSVSAASCAEANMAATAAIILGAEAPGWLDARHLPARLVACPTKDIRTPPGRDLGGPGDPGVTLVAGWPDGDASWS